jgi:hypothetical protein
MIESDAAGLPLKNEGPDDKTLKGPQHMNILYLKEAKETVEALGKRLEETVKAHKFGVISVIDHRHALIAQERIHFPPLNAFRRLGAAHYPALAM